MPSWSIDFLATAAPEEVSSGLSREVWELGARLARRGHKVRVLYPSEDLSADGTAHEGVARVVVPLIGVTRRPFGRDIAIGRNASALISRDTDLVVGNDEKAGALSLPHGSRPGRPVYLYFAHDVAMHTFETLRPLEPPAGIRQKVGNFLDRRSLRRLEGAALSRAQRVIVGTEYNRELLARYYPMPSQRVVLVPYGVPDPLDVGTREEARLAVKVPSDVPVVAFIGRTPERQGLPIAVEAFRRMRSLFPGARMLVVGSTVPTEPGVMSLGVVDEATKAKVLRAADVFLFPARYEGFGIAPREAMRYGVATIVSAHVPLEGAGATMVRRVESDDPQEYARELAELFADPALRRRVGEEGKTWADAFSFEQMALRFEETVGPLLPN